MANTYTQIHIQTVFAVQGRANLITTAWKDELYRYITGIIQNHGHKLLQINGMPDHLHILFGMRPTQALSVLMQQVKQDSSAWINQKGFVRGRFSWQEGYGAFSYSKRDVPDVIENASHISSLRDGWCCTAIRNASAKAGSSLRLGTCRTSIGPATLLHHQSLHAAALVHLGDHEVAACREAVGIEGVLR